MNRDLSRDRFRTKIFLICDAFRLCQRGIVVIFNCFYCDFIIYFTVRLDVVYFVNFCVVYIDRTTILDAKFLSRI